MTEQWEYRVVEFLDEAPDAQEAALNELGLQGWEAVGYQTGEFTHVLLKRARRRASATTLIPGFSVEPS